MSWNTLEMFGLEPSAPIRLADRLLKWVGAVGPRPDFSGVFQDIWLLDIWEMCLEMRFL